MTTKTLLGSLAIGTAVALTAATGALAERSQGAKERFNAVDTDGNGLISSEEYTVKRGTDFVKIDTDGSGAISQAEMMAHMEKRRAKREAKRAEREAKQAEKRPERAAKMFERADRNGDGQITLQEFEANGNQRFARMDKNGDGALGPNEMKRKRHAGKKGGKGGKSN